MPEDMRVDCVETVSSAIETALEKQPQNYENAAKAIKIQMDKKYGKSWHCIIGEGYGFSITHEAKNLLYLYFNGNLAVLVFKGELKLFQFQITICHSIVNGCKLLCT